MVASIHESIQFGHWRIVKTRIKQWGPKRVSNTWRGSTSRCSAGRKEPGTCSFTNSLLRSCGRKIEWLSYSHVQSLSMYVLIEQPYLRLPRYAAWVLSIIHYRHVSCNSITMFWGVLCNRTVIDCTFWRYCVEVWGTLHMTSELFSLPA